MKIKSNKNFPLEDSFSSSCLSSTSSTLPSKGNFVVYLRLFDPLLCKCLWSQITFKNGQNCSDQCYTGPVTQILEEENSSWREDMICVMENRFFKFDGISGLTLEPTIGGWKKVPSRKKLDFVSGATCLNKSLYVIQDLRGPPFNYHIPCDGWIEVLRPQSNDWEPLSCPPPRFSSRSTVFFHAVEELDKLLFGSFEDNVLYLYDPQAMALPEKVKNFCSTFSFPADTIVVGRYLIWHHRAKIYVYDLVSKWLRHEDIVGMDNYVRLTSPHCVSCKFLYFGDGRFCVIFLDFDQYGGTSVLRFFEFSLFGPSFLFPHATSSYTHEFGQCEKIESAFVMAEGESESAKLISDFTAAAGNGQIELRRIEASKEVAATLAEYEYPTAA